MELVAYLHSEMLCERLHQGESIDQNLDCQLLGAIAQSSVHAKSVVCVGLAAGAIAINMMPIAAFSYTPEIASVQELLAKRGFNPGAIDGVKGTSTTEAVVAAQTFYKLEADGVVGTETIAALESDPYEIEVSSNPSPDNQPSNANILEVQKLLAKRGFNPGAIDGVKGTLTREAIVAAQTFYKLEADGVVGSETIAALEADTYEVDVPTAPDPDSKADNHHAHKSVAKSQVTANLQQSLRDRGFYDGAIDGINGPKTKEGVVKAQEAYGLIPDGVAGSITMAALEADTHSSSENQNVATNQPTNDVYSDRVLEGQTLLSELGLYNGDLDGVQGSRTTAAIKQAQALYGLPVDGVLGNQTLDALKS
jgi:peptidoglycan hydrolase-like protein with peptidoglycan-binding domain